MSHHVYLPPEMDEAVRAFIRKHKRGLRWGCLAAALLALLLGGVSVWALYRGAGRVKDWMVGKAPPIRLPVQWEKKLGDTALAQLRGQFRFVTNPQVIDPLNRLAAPLFAGLTNSADRFTLFVTESKEVNALALPGGYIAFHRGLLERARTAEEIQGVLAHEMAHVELRHGVLQLAQNLGLDLVIQQLQGGENGMLDALLRNSGQLLGLKFSRDHERAADDRGWVLLEQTGINPQGMADFFAGLNAAREGVAAPPSPLLSTHPAPQERLDRLRQKAAALGPREFRSFTQEFKALQTGLGITLERP
ncbi:MAG: M48 family metallopeptidase [Verrucomicrobiota bacterium]